MSMCSSRMHGDMDIDSAGVSMHLRRLPTLFHIIQLVRNIVLS